VAGLEKSTKRYEPSRIAPWPVPWPLTVKMPDEKGATLVSPPTGLSTGLLDAHRSVLVVCCRSRPGERYAIRGEPPILLRSLLTYNVPKRCCLLLDSSDRIAGRSRVLGLLLGAGTGCADRTRHRNPQSETISNGDVAQIQPVVRSHSVTMRNVDAARQLAAGIYSVENNKWRWTAGDFSIVLATPGRASTHGADLLFAFYIPDAIMRRTGPVTLTAYLNEAEVGMMTYRTAGAQRFSAMIPPE
jgi:hypothetical protein